MQSHDESRQELVGWVRFLHAESLTPTQAHRVLERIEIHGAVLRSVGPRSASVPPTPPDPLSGALAERGDTVLSGPMSRLAAAVLGAVHLVAGKK